MHTILAAPLAAIVHGGATPGAVDNRHHLDCLSEWVAVFRRSLVMGVVLIGDRDLVGADSMCLRR